MPDRLLEWYEFFAGGGMARLGLGPKWKCAFANEWSAKKASSYRAYFGDCGEVKVADVANLTTSDLPGEPDLVWASFPCQDLSLAGSGAGLNGARSGAFKPFWRLVQRLVKEGREPALVVLENVVGTLTSHQGRDFHAIVRAFSESGYNVGALVIDAIRFLPQSRPRLFLIGVQSTLRFPTGMTREVPSGPWHPSPLVRAVNSLPLALKRAWVWWCLPVPNGRVPRLLSLIEAYPTGTAWHTEAETKKILRIMRPLHRRRLAQVESLPGKHVGMLYKRTRPDARGKTAQCAEVRFDGVAGCLRTPVGGSSRQTVLIVENGVVRTRLLSPREAARLMGVPDSYPLPANYNDGYHLFGDGVAVPVVRWLNEHLLLKLVPNRDWNEVRVCQQEGLALQAFQ